MIILSSRLSVFFNVSTPHCTVLDVASKEGDLLHPTCVTPQVRKFSFWKMNNTNGAFHLVPVDTVLRVFFGVHMEFRNRSTSIVLGTSPPNFLVFTQVDTLIFIMSYCMS